MHIHTIESQPRLKMYGPLLCIQVRALPEQLEYYGKGPLLGAKDLDINVLWERARQMQHACEEVCPLSCHIVACAGMCRHVQRYQRASGRLATEDVQSNRMQLEHMTLMSSCCADVLTCALPMRA